MYKAPPTNDMVVSLMETKEPLDKKMGVSKLQLVRGGESSAGTDHVSEDSAISDDEDVTSDGESDDEDVTSDGESDDEDVMSDGESDGEDAEMSLQAGTRQKVHIKKSGDKADDGSEDMTSDEDVKSFFDNEAIEGDTSSVDTASDSHSEGDSEGDSDSEVADVREYISDEAIESPTYRSSDDDICSVDDRDSAQLEDVSSNMYWKSNLAEKAKMSYENRYNKSSQLQKMVYENTKTNEKKQNDVEFGGLFTARKKSEICNSIYHQMDTSLVNIMISRDWSNEDIAENIKHYFVTGDWGDKDAQKILEQDDKLLYGDYEDLETGENYIAMKEEQRKMKKEKLKKAFDSFYDNRNEV